MDYNNTSTVILVCLICMFDDRRPSGVTGWGGLTLQLCTETIPRSWS